MEIFLAEKVLKKLLSGKEGKLDFKKYSLLRSILHSYQGDYAVLFNMFFPAETVARKIAETLKIQYFSYETLKTFFQKNNINIRKLNILPGVIFLKAKNPETNDYFFIAFSYYFSNRRVENTIATRLGETVKAIKHYKISVDTYKKIYTESRLLTGEEFKNWYFEKKKTNSEEILEEFYTGLIKQAAYRNSSDVHIETAGDLAIIRFRTAGALEPYLVLNDRTVQNLVEKYLPSRTNLSSGLSPNAPRIEDARDVVELESGEKVNLRLAFAPVMTPQGVNYRLVIRLLRMNTSLMSGLDSLGLTEVELDLLKSALRASNGIILTSGPTSSGKSTTLYGLLLNVDWDRKVITIEDPVEFSNPYLWTQHQISKAHSLDFRAFLRIVLREDPDVVLVGEIRDPETAKAMVEMANTGHLTFSTIHANNSVDVVKRLTDLGLPLKEVVEYGLIFMAQRLLRKSCPHCRYEGELSKAEAEILGLEEGMKVLRNRGCEKCGGTGTLRDRVLVLEILPVMKEDVKEMLLQGKGYREVYRTLEPMGYKSMVKKALELNRKGIVSVEEILDKMRG